DKDEGEEKEEKEDGGEEKEEEEEEEPEDLQPTLRDECKQSSKCAPSVKHFEHCSEKVEEGKGFKHEDCVEELYVTMMHCVDECAGPKLFSQLR
ncbi:Non-heme 11 kDa protein of cytochrome bc1 complex, partial [Sistotremastrum niveocremeum HHB9708]